MILNNFNVLILKINFKKIKNIYYFKVFSNKKHFKKTISAIISKTIYINAKPLVEYWH
jgi:hypothetical protein